MRRSVQKAAFFPEAFDSALFKEIENAAFAIGILWSSITTFPSPLSAHQREVQLIKLIKRLNANQETHLIPKLFLQLGGQLSSLIVSASGLNDVVAELCHFSNSRGLVVGLLRSLYDRLPALMNQHGGCLFYLINYLKRYPEHSASLSELKAFSVEER